MKPIWQIDFPGKREMAFFLGQSYRPVCHQGFKPPGFDAEGN